ncbi:MAG: hypothetical protein ACREHG_08040, partial [Candidatus Saccharimonadales bacterium]
MANQSLINNKVDLITTKLIDLHGRKVTGASPSSQPTDYVIRSEITSLLPQSSNAPTAAPTSFTYSLYVSGTLAIDDDIANRLYVTNKVQPKIVRADVKIAPTGNDIIVNINLAGSAWMSLTIKGGTTSSQ